MQKTCVDCGCEYKIDNADLQFLKKMTPTFGARSFEISPPKLCPQDRFRRRLAFRNELHLYKSPCDLCKKTMVTSYRPNVPFPVYCQECWWGDSWNELDYGRDYDFSTPFFQQYQALRDDVPRLALMNRNAENSEYCNYAAYNKNCYLAVGGSWYNEDCMYVTYNFRSRSCVDCFGLQRGELCYEMMWGRDLYGCIHCNECFDCADCAFSINLRGCKNCILCSNLHNKEYHIRNEPVSKEEFEYFRLSLGSHSIFSAAKEEFSELCQTSIRPASVNVNSEGCTGDYLRNCKNVKDCFMTTDLEDGRYLFIVEESKDMMDCSCAGFNGCELYYECLNAGDGGMLNVCSFNNWTSSNIYYCDTAQMCNNCFGCVGVRHKNYCIMNKQYTKEEYVNLVPKIIEHMQSTGEWGDNFPISLSPFAYNETLAQDYFPLEKEEALAKGFAWQDGTDEQFDATKVIGASELPDAIADTPEEIINWAICCEKTNKPYRVNALEYDFYKRTQLPIPRLHPTERERLRRGRKNNPQLHARTCSKCEKEIQSTYKAERPEKVYCNECYKAEVY